MLRRLLSKRGWLLEILLFLILFFAVRAWFTRDLAAGPAPPLDGLTLDGQPAVLTQGEPVLVHFWATWCPICGAEEGTIDALARDHHVITVALQSGSNAELKSHLNNADLHFPVIPDPDGRIAAAWGVSGVPATFVVKNGTIRYSERGYTTSLGMHARLWLAEQFD